MRKIYNSGGEHGQFDYGPENFDNGWKVKLQILNFRGESTYICTILDKNAKRTMFGLENALKLNVEKQREIKHGKLQSTKIKKDIFAHILTPISELPGSFE